MCRKLPYLIPYTSVWREAMNGQSAFCLGNGFKQQPCLNRHFGSIHRLRYISYDGCLWCWIAPARPSMPQWNLSINCLLTWMSTSLEVEGRESQWASGWWKLWHMDVPVVPMLEKSIWLDATNRCSRKLPYLIPYTSVWRETLNVQSAFCLENDCKQQPWLNRHFGSIHRLRYIYLTIAACGVGLPQYAPVCPSET